MNTGYGWGMYGACYPMYLLISFEVDMFISLIKQGKIRKAKKEHPELYKIYLQGKTQE